MCMFDLFRKWYGNDVYVGKKLLIINLFSGITKNLSEENLSYLGIKNVDKSIISGDRKPFFGIKFTFEKSIFKTPKWKYFAVNQNSDILSQESILGMSPDKK